MNFLTLSYNCVTISFLPEIWFWGPNHPTFLPDVIKYAVFFFEGSPNCIMHSIFLTEIITSQLKKKITTTFDPDIQKILNHFFFLFIFPRPGG